MSKSASIGIGIGVGVVAIVIGIFAVTYQDNFDDTNGLTQTDSEVGLSGEVEVSVERNPEEPQTNETKSYEFYINSSIGFSNPP